MLSFVSEENYRMHLDYLNTLKLKLSVISKSLSDIKGGTGTGGVRQGWSDSRASLEKLRCEIMLHEVYFDSFSEREYPRSAVAARKFGSENELLNNLYKRGMDTPYGFVGVRKCDHRGPEAFAASEYERVRGRVLLAVDVSEHAYFYDYGFEKGEYLKRALAHLSLGMLDDFS